MCGYPRAKACYITESSETPVHYYRASGTIFWNYKKSDMQPSPAKDWCFTINNPQDFHQDALLELDYSYLVFQVEIGEEGTPHIQGFVQLERKQRLTAIIKHMKAYFPEEDEDEEEPYSNHGHWSKRRGTPSEAAHYCKKPVPDCDCPHCEGLERFDNYVEYGHLSMGTAQQKVAEVVRVIKAKGLSHAIERFPEVYAHMHSGMEKIATFYLPDRDFQPVVTVLWGKSRCGKTRYAYNAFPTPYLLPPSGRGQTDFVGDYRPDFHMTLIMDDFYGQWRYSNILRLWDRYPMEVQTKGGYRKFLARHIVVTSNVPPNEWYKTQLSDPRKAEAFFNRIHNIIHFPGSYGLYTIKKVINYIPILQLR